MKSDSFEIFQRYKNLVNEKLSEFISNYENASERTKELIHYKSVINVSREIIRFNNSEANGLKDLIIVYIESVKDIDYENDTFVYDINDKRKKSLELYKKYIEPNGLYLISKSEFRPGLPLFFYLIIGIFLDFIIYKFVSKSFAPLATILIIILGFFKEVKKRKGKKMFKPYY